MHACTCMYMHTHTHRHTHTHTSSPAEPNTILLATVFLQQLNNVKLVIIVLNICLWVIYKDITHSYTNVIAYM